MPNPYVNKVIYDGNTLIDLTIDDVSSTDVLSGKKFHLPSGEAALGACTYDSDTTDATASASEILATKTAYVNKNKITGSMVNNGGVTGTISTVAYQYTVPTGFHDGSGKVSIDATEQAKIIATNIKNGVQILGVTGTYSGDPAEVQSKTATPMATSQVILPDAGYDYLSQVTVNAVPYVETDNLQGGKTVTIL